MKDRIERALESPGWMRLFKGFGGLWAAFWVIAGVVMLVMGELDHGGGMITVGLAVPLSLYVLARLTAWVVRGFLE